MKKEIAETGFAEGESGTLIEVLLKPPVAHAHIRVPKDKKFTFYDEEEVILFPFFHY